MPDWRKENRTTLICTTIIVVGTYAMGAGGMSFWGLLMLLNINYLKVSK